MILHYFGLVHSRRALHGIEPQVSPTRGREARDLVRETPERRDLNDFVLPKAAPVHGIWRK